MNNRHYEDIFEEFKDYHPYLVNDYEDWRPRGDRGVRVIMKNGDKYDYDTITKCVRRVEDHSMFRAEDITEERCRASIAYHLTELMGLRGYTQQTLSEYTGLGKGSIYNYVNGKATPSATALRKMAQALDCSVADLLD